MRKHPRAERFGLADHGHRRSGERHSLHPGRSHPLRPRHQPPLHIAPMTRGTSKRSESISLADQPGAKKRIEETILFVVDKYESVGDKALKRLCSRARRRHLRSRHELRRVHVASAEFRQCDEHFLQIRTRAERLSRHDTTVFERFHAGIIAYRLQYSQ